MQLPHAWSCLLAVALIGAIPCQPVTALVGTLTYQNPLPISAGGAPINIHTHAAPRLVDWDADRDLDLLVAGGDGYIWLFINSGSSSTPSFEPGVKVQAGGADLRAGTGYTGACLSDLTGDALPDLLVACCDNSARLYPNIGTLAAPSFSAFVVIPGPSGEPLLPPDCAGRIDVADWDGDGLQDIIAGGFDGYLTFFQNTGSATVPRFGSGGERFQLNHTVIQWPYNTHPRVFDVNQDGVTELTYGINWGYFGFLTRAEDHPSGVNLSAHFLATDATGHNLNIRPLIDDDTIPDYADLNGDGVLDLVSGGFNGQLFVMYGIPYTVKLERIDSLMQAHVSDLGQSLIGDASFRNELFGSHWGMRDFVTTFLGGPVRQQVADWYAGHVGHYPQYLRKQYLDPTAYPCVPSLAGQVWINLFESSPDGEAQRTQIADTIGLQGLYRNILAELGVLLIDNSRADATQQSVVYEFLSLLPRDLWDAECITISDFLGPNLPPGIGIRARSGVNIFPFRVGQISENSFPPDSLVGRVDTFSICLVHEINHTVDAHTFSANPSLLERKQSLIEQASPPDIVFLNHSIGLGVDWGATKARFQSLGLWDGASATWSDAWNRYWRTGTGSGYNDHWLRNNLQLMCEAPQEAFATLANQYFTSGPIMFDLCLRRWDRGITSCINQFLFCADVYAQGGPTTYLYRMDTAGRLTREQTNIGRNGHGFINRIAINGSIYRFDLDPQGNVTAVRSELVAPADFDRDGDVDIVDVVTFHGCFEGPDHPPQTSPCDDPDFDGDGDVDLVDFATLQTCFGGPDLPPGCF